MEAAAYAFENLALCAFETENFHTGLSLKKKKIVVIFSRLFLLEKHIEKIILNELQWAVHMFGKIYFKDGFN